ncbi:hypothetical protein C8R44DRAFT_884093 [Mycena epipterygia]|nr:hypothetical protein C8R44DRAFT_884093 [Mycena epipterygia]
MQEQEVQARALEAEILSLKAKVLVHKRTKPVRKYLAAVSTPPERPQETAEAPQATETKVPPSARQAVVKSQPVASTSQASPSSIVIKPEIFEEEDDWILDSDSGALTYLTPVPESRRQELQVFPEFVPDADCSAVFTRQFLSNILGGSIQPLIVNLTANRKALAEERNINRFLCVNWRNNSWAPPLPGQHGFMFVGLGTERDTFLDPEELNVFLSIPPKGKGKLEVSYLGRYEVHRVSALSVPEWQTLPRVVQRNYIDITAARGIGISGEHKSKTHANIRAGYDSGALMVPCVRLICTGFDERLYDGLVAAYPIWCKERETSDGRPSAKRRRTGSI